MQDQSSQRGSLLIAEVGKEVPFDIKRFYTISKVPAGETRGTHAHKKTRQAAFAIAGSCEVMLDDGKNKQTLALQKGQGVLLEAKVWHSLSNFSADTQILIVADALYDADDYVHTYEEFLSYIK